MFALALLVASIGIADSVNPTTIGPAILLAAGQNPLRAVASFTAGVFLVSFAAGVLVILGPGQLLLDAIPHPSSHARHVAELLGGAVLILLAVGLWLGREAVESRIAGSGSEERERSAFVLGAGIMAVELPTAFPYFAALASILAAHASLGQGIALVAVFNVAFVSPLIVILAVRALAGERASAVLERVGNWFLRQAGTLVALLLGAVGAAAVVVGLVGLV
jgi:threonine/homoserine/homoserine lactone efflux protein